MIKPHLQPHGILDGDLESECIRINCTALVYCTVRKGAEFFTTDLRLAPDLKPGLNHYGDVRFFLHSQTLPDMERKDQATTVDV